MRWPASWIVTAATVALSLCNPALAIDLGGGGSLSGGQQSSTPIPDPSPGTALFTNAVTYCAEARAVLIDQFDIAYWRHNNSVTFSFSFASVEDNLNVTARLYLNDYGNVLFNETMNICDYVSGVLCPLPQVNFTGYGTYPLPDDIQSQVPNIAWTVPNLEAYARIELIDNSTNQVAACLQATLSNGWSTQYPGVKWGSGMFTLVAFIAAIVHSMLINSISPALYRWYDVLFLYQTAAAGGLMHLNYPLVFSNFAHNFAWSLGLFSSRPMQDSINTMRNKTGGHMATDAYSDVRYINRKLSPYNELYALNMNTVLPQANVKSLLTSYMKSQSQSPVPRATSFLSKRAKIPSLINQQGASELTTGIPVYTNSMGIPQANAYDTVFFVFLAFLAIMLAFHLILGAVVYVFGRRNEKDPEIKWINRLRITWWDFVAANMLRVCLAGFFPLFIFGFYQWTIGSKDSGLSIFFTVFGMLAVLVPLVVALVLSVLRARQESYARPDITRLYTDYHFFHSVGILYRQYRQKYHFWWFAPTLIASIARAAFIGFAQASGWVQVIGCLAVEFILFISLLVCRPHKDRGGNWLAPILSLFRLAYFGLLVTFLQSINVKPIPRTVIGIVQIALIGIPTILLLISLIWNLGYGYFWRRSPMRRTEDGADLESVDEDKGSVQPVIGPVGYERSQSPSPIRSATPASTMPPRYPEYGVTDNGYQYPYKTTDGYTFGSASQGQERNSAYLAYQAAADGTHTHQSGATVEERPFIA